MNFNVEKFKKIASSKDDELQKKLDEAIRNEDWRLNLLHIVIRIRGIMQEQGISQIKLAEYLGVSKSEVSKLLSGKENLSMKTIFKIEKALGQPIIEIVGANSNSKEIIPA